MNTNKIETSFPFLQQILSTRFFPCFRTETNDKFDKMIQSLVMSAKKNKQHVQDLERSEEPEDDPSMTSQNKDATDNLDN